MWVPINEPVKLPVVLVGANDALVANELLTLWEAFNAQDDVPKSDPVNDPVKLPVVLVGANDELSATDAVIAQLEVPCKLPVIEGAVRDPDIVEDPDSTMSPFFILNSLAIFPALHCPGYV